MNKAQLVAEVQKSLGADTSKAAAERSIEAVLDGIKKGVKKDKNVQLIGFGTFSVTKRAARPGFNPKTREKIRIKASNAVRFKAGAGLKEVVNPTKKAPTKKKVVTKKTTVKKKSAAKKR